MTHYDITIIGTKKDCMSLARTFKNNLKVLFLDTFRNRIKHEEGYTIILYKDKKNVQIFTDIFINLTICQD